MTFDQVFLFSLMTGVLGLLVWGRWRYDLIAFGALVVACLAGPIPAEQAFSGFGHPATIIIALVLVVSRGLSNSGAVELLTRHVVDASRSRSAHIGIMAGLASVLSALMNNVATLALLMPVDMQAAAKAKRSPALTLMPLSFASILGGMATLIGTPPNVVVATFRAQALGEPYGMFDFTPVGAAVAGAGILFLVLVGWRLVPAERHKHDTLRELENAEGYVAEATVPEGCKHIDDTVREIYPLAEEHGVSVLGLVRRGKRLPSTASRETIHRQDVLVLEGSPEDIEQFVGAAGLKYSRSKKHMGLASEALSIAEVVVPQGAFIEGRSALEVRLLQRQGVILLGISRRGQPTRERVRKMKIRAGDLLLLLGTEERLPEVIAWLGCLPLAEREYTVAQRQKAWLAVSVFVAAILAASVGWVSLPVALGGVAVAYAALRIVPLSQIYQAVEWPVIVLLGSLIPIGRALETSGGTALLGRSIVEGTAGVSPVIVLAVLMALTMTLSDVLNNVATALIAAPIGVDIAARLGVNPDPFLMGVAVASSCAFLTPIGHKNNIIIMGPGGYRFGDYWRMGLPLEALVLAVGLVMILLVWPL